MKEKTCCRQPEKRSHVFWQGLIYGLIPHTFCILFIVFSVLGTTVASAIFKPFLLNKFFFYSLIAFSLLAATASAIFYLRRNNLLSLVGIKRKWTYLTVLYGTTIVINLILFLIVFPATANFSFKTDNSIKEAITSRSLVTLKVDIPCSGHAPLVSEELKKVKGITEIKFRLPNIFDIHYDSSLVDQTQILNQSIFKEFKASVL